MTPRYLTVDGFVAAFGVGRTLTYQLLGEGVIPSIKIGRRRLINAQAATEWFASQSGAPINMQRRAAA